MGHIFVRSKNPIQRVDIRRLTTPQPHITIVTRKGGPGSGHHGHRGRPGKRGGSLPGGGTGAVYIKGTQPPEVMDAMFKPGTTVRDVAKPYLLPGYYNLVETVSPAVASEDFLGVGIRALYYDDEGTFRADIEGPVWSRDPVGASERDLYLYPDGSRLCWNESLYFDKDFQQRGLATGIYDKQLQFLSDQDFDRLDFNAGGTIGRYAWAKRGFDYRYPERLRPQAADKLRHWVQSNDLTRVSDEQLREQLKSAYDVATWQHPEQEVVWGAMLPTFDNAGVDSHLPMNVGKAFMLDLSPKGHGTWPARLNLGDPVQVARVQTRLRQKSTFPPPPERKYAPELKRKVIESPESGFDDSWFHIDYVASDIIKGGPGSGHYGHRGRPGVRGGSLPGVGAITFGSGPATPEWVERLGVIQPSIGPDERGVILRTMEVAGTPQDHLEHLNAISKLGGWELDPETWGIYRAEDRWIRMSPLHLSHVPAYQFLHELGHHITLNLARGRSLLQSEEENERLVPLWHKINNEYDPERALRELKLPLWVSKSGRASPGWEMDAEMLADLYRGWADPETRDAWLDIGHAGDIDLEELFMTPVEGNNPPFFSPDLFPNKDVLF